MRIRVTLIAAAALAGSCTIFSPSLANASIAGNFCLLLKTPAALSNPTQTAQRNTYVVLQAWETELAASLKAANPNLSVLVYQNLSAMANVTGPKGISSSGVSAAEAVDEDPGWFLKDRNGKRIAEKNYPWLWMADIGNPSYQQRWTANVLGVLQSGPWDGVMMDDTNPTTKYHVGSVSEVAKYPTDKAYQGAVRSMLAYAGPRIISAGKLAIPNMGAWQEYPEVIDEWLTFVSGGMDQMFVKWSSASGDGYLGPMAWQRQLEEVQTTERMGKRFLAVTHVAAGDTEAMRYGWASALLGAGGDTAFFADDECHCDNWSSEYEIPIGEPTSSAYVTSNGVWKRDFTNGLVVVNPTTSEHNVSFGGVYSSASLTDAESSNLAPHSALILTRREALVGSEKGVSVEEVGGASDEVAPVAVPVTGSATTGTPRKKARRDVSARCQRMLAGKHRLSRRRRFRCHRIVRVAQTAKKHSRSG